MLTSFGDRHDDLPAILDDTSTRWPHRLDDPAAVADAAPARSAPTSPRSTRSRPPRCSTRRSWPTPTRPGSGPGHVRFVMSLRAVGEGHLSSSSSAPASSTPTRRPPLRRPGRRVVPRRASADDATPRDPFPAQLAELGGDRRAPRSSSSCCPPVLPTRARCRPRRAARPARYPAATPTRTIDRLERIAASNYEIDVPGRVAGWRAGLCRPVPVRGPRAWRTPGSSRFVDDDGGRRLPRHLHGLRRRRTSPRNCCPTTTSGPSTQQPAQPVRRPKNKGMALFPRRVGGQYLALSRWDRENNSIATSADLVHWERRDARSRSPSSRGRSCSWATAGRPIETAAGWLVLTHGVGPMRQYCDRRHPARPRGPVQGAGPHHRAAAGPERRRARRLRAQRRLLVRGDAARRHLVLPYGCSDSSIRVAIVDVPTLVDGMLEGSL